MFVVSQYSNTSLNYIFNGVYTSGQMDFHHGGLNKFFPSMKHRGGVLIH